MPIFRILFLLLAATTLVQAQRLPFSEDSRKLIQLTGVVSSPNIGVIPYTAVKVKNTSNSIIANNTGFYAIVVRENDTVQFSAVGFKPYNLIVTPTQTEAISYNPSMLVDTLVFHGGTIYPWPTKEEFKQAFLKLKLKDGYSEIARKNLEQQTLNDIAESLPQDGHELGGRTLQDFQKSFYYSGGQKNYFLFGGPNGSAIPTSLLNPFAWAQFIKSIKNGDYNRKPEKKKKYHEVK
ncbi:MAG: carboxypeptidase-like regulatory domain-containing protein [Bacteroidetes bacterium]|nr:carboxypeptidase-like regulatory domain-containing protein [Bacteroidota bacterium]